MNSNSRWVLAVLVIVLVGIGGYAFLNKPDNRTAGEHIGDAIDALPDVGKAGKELGDRTPGDRLNDAADDVKKDLNMK
jgi:hypothetical protein